MDFGSALPDLDYNIPPKNDYHDDDENDSTSYKSDQSGAPKLNHPLRPKIPMFDTTANISSKRDTNILEEGTEADQAQGLRFESVDSFKSFTSIATSSHSIPTKQAIKTKQLLAIFPELPFDSFLIDDFSCAWQKEILVQGRLWITSTHICFYANILSWVYSALIDIKDIIGVEKRVIAGFIPNSIEILTKEKNYFFATFLQRDHTYDLLKSVCDKKRQEDQVDDDIELHLFSSNESLPKILNSETIKSPAKVYSDLKHRRPTGLAEISSPSPTKSIIMNVEKNRFDSFSEASSRRDSLSDINPSTCIKKIHEPFVCTYDTSSMKLICTETFTTTLHTLLNIYFTDDSTDKFWASFFAGQGCKEISVTKWKPSDTLLKSGMSREASYIQPVDSKLITQTKCETEEKIIQKEPNGICIESKCYTRDAPSGGCFFTKVVIVCTENIGIDNEASVFFEVYCDVVFEKFSFLKSVIVSGTIQGITKNYMELISALGKELLDANAKNQTDEVINYKNMEERHVLVSDHEDGNQNEVAAHSTPAVLSSKTTPKQDLVSSEVLDAIIVILKKDPRFVFAIRLLTISFAVASISFIANTIILYMMWRK